MDIKDDVKLENKIKEVVSIYLRQGAFIDRKPTDTATDALQVVNRKFVTQNGTTASRPQSSIFGQYYFDTTIGRPIYLNPSTGRWVDGAGSIS